MLWLLRQAVLTPTQSAQRAEPVGLALTMSLLAVSINKPPFFSVPHGTACTPQALLSPEKPLCVLSATRRVFV
jgi:hypothetical protein